VPGTPKVIPCRLFERSAAEAVAYKQIKIGTYRNKKKKRKKEKEKQKHKKDKKHKKQL